MTTRQELYAVLIALPGDTVLLPNAAVAEVISPERLQAADKAAPDWYAGTVPYNNRRLPALRFEVLNGGRRGEDGRRTRLAVIHAIGGRLREGQYALLCQGYPHLVTLNRKALRKEPPAPTDREAFVLTRVSIANTSAVIPNLEALEQELARLGAAAAGRH